MFSPPTTTTTFSSTWSTATTDQSSSTEDTTTCQSFFGEDKNPNDLNSIKAEYMKQWSNRKLQQQKRHSPHSLQIDILVLSGEQGGVGQSSLIYRFVTSEYKEHLSHCSSTIYTKEIQLTCVHPSHPPTTTELNNHLSPMIMMNRDDDRDDDRDDEWMVVAEPPPPQPQQSPPLPPPLLVSTTTTTTTLPNVNNNIHSTETSTNNNRDQTIHHQCTKDVTNNETSTRTSQLPSSSSSLLLDQISSHPSSECTNSSLPSIMNQSHQTKSFSTQLSNTLTLNIILNIEDYIPRYITDLENTDDRQSDCDALFDEKYFVECQQRQERHYSKMDAFIICFDAKQEDFIDFVYNELNTIKKACGGEDSSLYQSKVIVLAMTKQDDNIHHTNREFKVTNMDNHLLIPKSNTTPLSTTQPTPSFDSKRRQGELIQLLLSDTHLPLFRVSAKDNINVTELFNHVARQVLAFKLKHHLIPNTFFREQLSHSNTCNNESSSQGVKFADEPKVTIDEDGNDQKPPELEFSLPFRPMTLTNDKTLASVSARTVPPNYYYSSDHQQHEEDHKDSLHVDTHNIQRRHSYDQKSRSNTNRTKCLIQ
ncbi:hypothetical protein FDP41_009275 [Naegleria fowleri]|uniref:Uncharacterized protein n=1 Tax=Naegleria fowleri TaxID=5763 RepID=A0A6A5BBT7_NAEFO|nr:uncharacterized protein FDP41_009275 [Naegleria fowleri]KAF0972372.1 hypothetical protein FDP41_009275 [Naegleria fowleri]CAG4718236.1 unnamed protein product [Naegleria fowleri]